MKLASSVPSQAERATRALAGKAAKAAIRPETALDSALNPLRGAARRKAQTADLP
jgi:hypothetical protein